jgi:hypothetical protein
MARTENLLKLLWIFHSGLKEFVKVWYNQFSVPESPSLQTALPYYGIVTF